VRGRYTARGHDVHAQHAARRRVQHEADAVQPVDVGDLVRVGDHAGDAVRQRGLAEGGRRAHAALDVHVGVDQARRDIAPAQVDDVRGGVAFAHAHDDRVLDRDLGGIDFAGKDVDELQVRQQQVGSDLAARGGDAFR